MTGNQIKGKGFRGALRYNLDKVGRGVAEVLDHSFASLSEATIMKEVQLVRVLRPNLQKYFYHTSINFPPGENLSNRLMMQIGHDYLVAMGFTQNQFMMFRHYDADHPHLHILVNRIGYDGKVVSDSNNYHRSESSLRGLEVQYGLTRVTPSKEVRERAMTKNELEMMKRTNEPSQKMKLQVIIKGVLKERPGMTTQQFIEGLESKGINVLFNQANTGFVSGISYDLDGFIIKGAKLGTGFKWASIKKVINYEQERDRATIHEANIRTKAASPHTRPGSLHDQGNRTTSLENKEGNRGLLPVPGKSKLLYKGSGERNSTNGRSTQQPPSENERSAQRNLTENVRGDKPISEKSKNLDLASLLDGYSHGHNRDIDYESNLGSEGLTYRRKKKKRRGRRL